MKSFFGGCGIRDRHDCNESSSVPSPLYGANSCEKRICDEAVMQFIRYTPSCSVHMRLEL